MNANQAQQTVREWVETNAIDQSSGLRAAPRRWDQDQEVDRQHYIIRGGVEGQERLRLLARVMQPTTRALFDRVGVRAGMTCLDVGCGGGDVTIELARLVGPGGMVVGTDFDDTKLALARSEAATLQINNVEFRHAHLVDSVEEAAYDLLYTRFLLTHLPDPVGAMAKFHRVLRPGGIIVVEDIDVSGQFCYPDSPAFRRSVALYALAAERRGADPTIGRRLPRLLSDSGFACLELNIFQPAALQGELKLMTPLTLENIAATVLAEGLATQVELDLVIGELYALARDPDTLISLPRMVQVWGRR
jgi:ubiquinone/menaquinone biosynthesis C-methylase UbiE